ncbi:MAG: hypothetical protein BroJett031_28690 [Betaproteobacteria bacterium]|nr:MAG: hypothetical protein BroJett031_28690 [Betaproteobacteria bacterium]
MWTFVEALQRSDWKIPERKRLFRHLRDRHVVATEVQELRSFVQERLYLDDSDMEEVFHADGDQVTVSASFLSALKSVVTFMKTQTEFPSPDPEDFTEDSAGPVATPSERTPPP